MMISREAFEKQMTEENMGFDLRQNDTGYVDEQTELYYSVWTLGHMHCLEEYNDLKERHEFVVERLVELYVKQEE